MNYKRALRVTNTRDMVDLELDQEQISPSNGMSTKKKELLSTAMKRTSEWIFSQEIPSDITINVGGTSFSLHKFPLVSKSGYIRKLVSESVDTNQTEIEIPEIPGGAEAFELASNFCYGINFEINTENIAMLRCASEFLEMTEEHGIGNLVERTETYLKEVALKSLAGAVTVLHSCENFIHTAEKVKLVSRCVDTIAFVACKDSLFASTNNRPDQGDSVPSLGSNSKPIVHWWAEDLTVLRVDLFQRVLIAMVARGFKQYALSPILMLYAQKALRGLDIIGKGRKKMEPRQEHEKRVVLETIVSLLPGEKNSISVSFLSMMLRSAIYLDTTVACRLDLEKRMASQLGQAVLEDLLIPSYSFTGDTLFDIETVERIMTNYLDSERYSSNSGDHHEYNNTFPHSSNDMERVTKLMENYLSEIASDRNLSVSKFISLAELIPEQSRITEDGIYRAVDIYLKAHPALSDMERKKVCSVMDCQKLSREACAHAAQNDRLPVQTVVQVLYYEQQRLREAMDNSNSTNPNESPSLSLQPIDKPSIVATYTSDVHPVNDELTTLRRENQDLKLELVKMKMRLKEIERGGSHGGNNNKLLPGSRSPLAISSGNVSVSSSSADKPPLPKKSFIGSVSKKLGKLMKVDAMTQGNRRSKPSKDRRHSIS